MENKNKQSLPIALLLSFLVGLLGAGLWGVLYYFGWFVSIVAYITAFGMFFIYLKFYNKMNWLPFVWTLVWIIILNILASFLAVVIAVSIEVAIPLSEAFVATIEVFDVVLKDFIIDMLLGTLFSVLGVITYYKVYKNKRVEKVITEPTITYTTLTEEEMSQTNNTTTNNETLENKTQTDNENEK